MKLYQPLGIDTTNNPGVVAETEDGRRWLVRKHWSERAPYFGRVRLGPPSESGRILTRMVAACLGVPDAHEAEVPAS